MSGPIGPNYTGWNVPTGGGSGRLYVAGSLVATYDDATNDLVLPTNGLTVTAGGLTVTAGGLTVTAGALTVSDTASAHSIDGTDLSMPNLPTSDPGVAGQLWANTNVVTVSTGA